MNQDGIDLLKEFEGWRGKAYIPVPGDVWTIGYGFTKGVKAGDMMTKAQGEARLKKEILSYEGAVSKACTLTPNENQLAAMTCLAFNIGAGNFLKSTVLRAHNKGDEQAACRAFGLFNKSGGKVLAGLTRRRAAEAALYLKPEPEKQQDHPMPQTVDPEKSLAQSQINVSQVVAGATGAGSIAKGLLDQADTAKGAMDRVSAVSDSASGVVGSVSGVMNALDINLSMVIGVIILITCAVAIYYRWKQRNAGMA